MTARVATLLFIATISPLACRSRRMEDQGQRTAPRYLGVLLTALITYEDTYKSFPATLAALGPPEHGGITNADAANLVDSKLAAGVYVGYVFHYAPTASARTGKFDAFTITAEPAGSEVGNKLYYFTDQTAVIRVESNHPATVVSHPIH